MMKQSCLICGSANSKVVFPKWCLKGVTSDSKLWPRVGTIVCCLSCGHIQKQINETWRVDTTQIYGSYGVHSIVGGEEQKLFSSNGEPHARSLQVATILAKALKLPSTGKLLDIGCGTGGFLRQFHTLRTDWELCGQEIAGHFREGVLSLPGVRAFYESLEEIKEQFDLITMNDVLEHLTDPVMILGSLRKLLRPGGVLFARSPHFPDNPFDLIIADHCSHFTRTSIELLMMRTGFFMLRDPGEWFPKETGFLAVQSEVRSSQLSPKIAAQNELCCRRALEWLSALPDFIRRDAEGKTLGIFGTSIAGSWLAGIMPGEVSFFVDEDPSRQGASHLDLSVFSPDIIPQNSIVFLAFPYRVAFALRQRLENRYPNVGFLLPPEMLRD